MTIFTDKHTIRRALAAGALASASMMITLAPATAQVSTAHSHGAPVSSSRSHHDSSAGTFYGSASADFQVARLTTKRFQNLEAAGTAGYTVKFTDRLGFTCIADLPAPTHRSEGAMGVHFINPAFIGSRDPAHPAAVIYEPGRNGKMRLVGMEYLIVQPEQKPAPASFGQSFMFTPAGDATVNRFMPDAFYSLHVWAWKPNPSGRFAMWNPRVNCPK